MSVRESEREWSRRGEWRVVRAGEHVKMGRLGEITWDDREGKGLKRKRRGRHGDRNGQREERDLRDI